MRRSATAAYTQFGLRNSKILYNLLALPEVLGLQYLRAERRGVTVISKVMHCAVLTELDACGSGCLRGFRYFGGFKSPDSLRRLPALTHLSVCRSKGLRSPLKLIGALGLARVFVAPDELQDESGAATCPRLAYVNVEDKGEPYSLGVSSETLCVSLNVKFQLVV